MKILSFSLLVLLILFVVGCSSISTPIIISKYDQFEKNIGKVCRVTGILREKAYIKENMPAIMLNDKPVFLFADKKIPQSLYGKHITVTGKIVLKRWPMFIYDPEAKLNETPQGMPMPKGTNIDKIDKYYVIENTRVSPPQLILNNKYFYVMTVFFLFLVYFVFERFFICITLSKPIKK